MQFLETIRVDKGHAFHLSYHQERMERTLHAHGIKTNYRLSDIIAPPDSSLYRCRVLYNAESLDISYHPYLMRTFHSLQAVVDDAIEYPYKYSDRAHLERLFDSRGTSDDVVIVKNGFLTDTTIANIALYDGEQWVTPQQPLLMGTTRARLLDEGKIIEGDIPLEKLNYYSKTAVMNAMVGFVEVENGIIFPK